MCFLWRRSKVAMRRGFLWMHIPCVLIEWGEIVTRASCAGHDEPDLWFPIEVGGKTDWAHSPSAMQARTICASCPVIQACGEYALRFDSIAGIWGGTDRHERSKLQKDLGITPVSFSASYRRLLEEGVSHGKR